MSSQSKILVTGASGFVGAQVVTHLLLAGYAVRGTARSKKAEQLRRNSRHPCFEVTVVDDLVSGDFSKALRDVEAVVHVASPVIGKEDPIGVAIGGTMNIIRQAHQAKVFKITVLSSCAALFNTTEELNDSSGVLTDKDWRKTTKEDVKPDTPAIDVYTTSKTLAERAAWEYAEAHPELDLITILPPFIFGPLAKAQVITDVECLSTDAWIYQLFSRTAAYPSFSPRHAVDIRDVAEAIVLSLTATKRQPGERRRIILYGGSFTWPEVVRHIAKVRPNLKHRLVYRGDPPSVDQQEVRPAAILDTSKAKEILGISRFIDWRQTVESAVDSILEREDELLYGLPQDR